MSERHRKRELERDRDDLGENANEIHVKLQCT